MDREKTISALKARIQAIESTRQDVSAGQIRNSLSECTNDSLACLESGKESEVRTGEIENKTRDTLRKKASSQSAFSKIVTLINASEKSACELQKRLIHAGYESSEIDFALTRAIECGLVDDARYACSLVQSRIHQGWGSEGIERELVRNGIDPSSVEGWPYAFPFSHEEQVSRGFEFLQRRPPHARNLREGAYRKLINRGYGSSIASQAARLWYETICE